MVAVEVHDLLKRFGSFVAVDGISFQVERGEIFGFLGPNGAGKSTTIRMLCGLLQPSGGTATVAGIDVAADPEGVRRKIGYMSQKFSLYTDLTVSQNIDLFASLYGVMGDRYVHRRDWAFEFMQLSERAADPVATLPGGFRQRLALACALIHEPEVVFLDEPTGGVDPVMRRTFFELIEDLSSEGMTIFVTTHFLDEAEYCHRCAFIAAGRLIALGTPTELKAELGDRVMLELRTETPGAAATRLGAVEGVADASAFGAGLHVMGRSGVGEEALIRAVTDGLEGISFSGLHRIEPTLEDVFIHLTERAGT